MSNFSTLSLASNLVGSVTETVGKVKAAKGAQDLYNEEAKAATEAGEYGVIRAREQGRKVIGKQRAIIGGAGLDTSSGTPLDIMLETAKQAELEALTTRYNAGLQAREAKYRGKLYGAAASQMPGAAAIKGVSYFSDWYNKYGLSAGKKKPKTLEEFSMADVDKELA